MSASNNQIRSVIDEIGAKLSELTLLTSTQDAPSFPEHPEDLEDWLTEMIVGYSDVDEVVVKLAREILDRFLEGPDGPVRGICSYGHFDVEYACDENNKDHEDSVNVEDRPHRITPVWVSRACGIPEPELDDPEGSQESPDWEAELQDFLDEYDIDPRKWGTIGEFLADLGYLDEEKTPREPSEHQELFGSPFPDWDVLTDESIDRSGEEDIYAYLKKVLAGEADYKSLVEWLGLVSGQNQQHVDDPSASHDETDSMDVLAEEADAELLFWEDMINEAVEEHQIAFEKLQELRNSRAPVDQGAPPLDEFLDDILGKRGVPELGDALGFDCLADSQKTDEIIDTIRMTADGLLEDLAEEYADKYDPLYDLPAKRAKLTVPKRIKYIDRKNEAIAQAIAYLEELDEATERFEDQYVVEKGAKDGSAGPDADPGNQTLAEIRIEQKRTGLAIDPETFKAIVDEIAQDFAAWRDDEPLKFSEDALEALQVAAEEYLSSLNRESNLAGIHAGRTHVNPTDIQFIRRIRGERT